MWASFYGKLCIIKGQILHKSISIQVAVGIRACPIHLPGCFSRINVCLIAKFLLKSIVCKEPIKTGLQFVPDDSICCERGKNNKWHQCTWRPTGDHAAFACILSLALGIPISVPLLNEIHQPPSRLAEMHVQIYSTDIIFNIAKMLMSFSWPHVSFLYLIQHYLGAWKMANKSRQTHLCSAVLVAPY